MKVMFTEMEYLVLAKSAERLLKGRSKLTAKDWSKPQNKADKAFANKFSLHTQLDGKEQEVNLDRNMLRIIQETCAVSKAVLEQNVLPEYERRGLGNASNLEYHTKAKDLVRVYGELLSKVEALL